MNDEEETTAVVHNDHPVEKLDPKQIAEIMAMLGRSGGLSRSARKAKAARANGRKRHKAARVARRITRRNAK